MDAVIDKPDLAAVNALLAEVMDPEIPVLSVLDLGIVRDVTLSEEPGVTVTVTPTYSGCPAKHVIDLQIVTALEMAGISPVHIKTVLSPAWTTDWLSEAGREKLRKIGIAPPVEAGGKGALLGLDPDVSCPRCGSAETEELSRFGSTACKSLYRCLGCLEPFDYFKCI